MSADNWAICPKCKFDREDAMKKARLEAEKLYGKIPSGKFLSLVEDITSKEDNDRERTLREDYEIGMDEFGSFLVDYRASCRECQFKYSYSYVISINTEVCNE